MKSVSQYLKYIKMPDACLQEIGQCEICGCANFLVVRETVIVLNGIRAPIRVGACTRCGYLSQIDRFSDEFYAQYYTNSYRSIISGKSTPTEIFLQDQVHRGYYLFQNISKFIPKAGHLFDVGCGSGGFLVAFQHNGWHVQGIDPDRGAVEMGIERFGFDIQLSVAETMDLQDNSIDLILIAGSLEHVANPNQVLQLCRKALHPGSLILIEGWGLAQARLVGGFGHNQKRYLTCDSIRMLLLKNGFDVEAITEEPLCGPTRPNSIFGLGRCRPDFLSEIPEIEFLPRNLDMTALCNHLSSLGIK
ncbi:MAG: class I SAM-dependent methyltransferase [Sphingobacteriales bacterium]|nr:MAG: class I SAM-dependent methyltransferase [Sphingobacteriales bacterium]